MRRLLLFAAGLFFVSFSSVAQVTVFSDNFEAGTSKWTFAGNCSWGVVSTVSHSPSNSLTESTAGNYGNNWNGRATMVTGVDLSTYPSAMLYFWRTFKIEGGFDYMYLDVSTNDFTTFTTLKAYDGGESLPLPAFSKDSFDLGGFCGNANVKIRFRFYSDGGYVTDGMYIDDVEIIASTVDASAPLVVHNPLPFFEGALNDNVITADIIDFTGVNTTATELIYNVDGGADQTVSPVLVSGNTYSFTIPTQTPGAWVTYRIYAEDTYTVPNSITTMDYEFIAGNHIINDNGVVDFFGQFGPAVSGAPLGAAVKVVLGNTDLAALLIRNYTDNTHPNDSMLIHVWNDNAGVPGTDVITPFKVKPEATLSNTSAMTRIDLRPYSAQLTGLTGTYYIGYTVPTGVCNLTLTQPGAYARSFDFDGTTWTPAEGSSGASDYHFRAVTSLNQDVEGPNIVNNTIPVYYESDLSVQTVEATIMDMTGVASTTLHYIVDNGSVMDVAGVLVSGNDYTFSIPAQAAGAWVKYWIEATDAVTPVPYTSETDTFVYIAGNYMFQDNEVIHYYVNIDIANGTPYAAVQYDFGTEYGDLVTILIKNFVLASSPGTTPNDDMRIHVWGDNAGMPGTDLITPFMVASEASVTNPIAMTRIDLRGFTALEDLTGLFYVGFNVPTGSCAILEDTTVTANYYSFVGDGTDWAPNTNGHFHIRIITSDLITENGGEYDLNNLVDLYPNPASTNVELYVEHFNGANVVVMDINGRVVMQKELQSNYTELNVESMDAGLYLIRITNEKGVITKKLVVE